MLRLLVDFLENINIFCNKMLKFVKSIAIIFHIE